MWQELIFITNVFASFFLTGLIWLIQLVHYPSFRFVNEDDYPAFQKHHVYSIGKVVIPVMIAEIFTSFVLSWFYGFLSLHALGFYLILLIWGSTGLFSIPIHSKLESGKNLDAINRLVSTNWIRTILWTLKSVISFYLLFCSIG